MVLDVIDKKPIFAAAKNYDMEQKQSYLSTVVKGDMNLYEVRIFMLIVGAGTGSDRGRKVERHHRQGLLIRSSQHQLFSSNEKTCCESTSLRRCAGCLREVEQEICEDPETSRASVAS